MRRSNRHGALALFLLGFVGLCEFSHAVKAEIIARHVARVHCRAKSVFVMAAVNPAIRQAVAVGGAMIVEHALGCVQDI